MGLRSFLRSLVAPPEDSWKYDENEPLPNLLSVSGWALRPAPFVGPHHHLTKRVLCRECGRTYR